MISLPSSTSIWIAAGVTDMRRGFTGLSAVAQTVLEQNPYSGHVFVLDSEPYVHRADASDSESLIPDRYGQNVWGIVQQRKTDLGMKARETCVPQSYAWGTEAQVDEMVPSRRVPLA